MHPQIVEDSSFAAGQILAFPVGGFVRIEVAAMVKTRNDLQQPPEFATARKFVGSLGTREKRHFGTATDKAAAFIDGVKNATCRGQIDAKWFFGKQILSAAKTSR